MAGEVWRERRRQYAERTVRVVEVDDGDHGFAYVQSLTGYDGKPVQPRKPTRVRLSLWSRYWTPVGGAQ